jgi:hypothetical protein
VALAHARLVVGKHHVARTQAVKAAANRPGLMRFINCVSQRPPGTPW